MVGVLSHDVRKNLLWKINNVPEQDMVSSLEPWRTPSQVWMASEDLTGMVPSPDSILVRNWPRALRFGCGSVTVLRAPSLVSLGSNSWGEKILASPQGAVLMYKWNRMPSFNWYPLPSGLGWKIETWSVSKFSNCEYRNERRHRRLTISAWQSNQRKQKISCCSYFQKMKIKQGHGYVRSDAAISLKIIQMKGKIQISQIKLAFPRKKWMNCTKRTYFFVDTFFE